MARSLERERLFVGVEKPPREFWVDFVSKMEDVFFLKRRSRRPKYRGKTQLYSMDIFFVFPVLRDARFTGIRQKMHVETTTGTHSRLYSSRWLFFLVAWTLPRVDQTWPKVNQTLRKMGEACPKVHQTRPKAAQGWPKVNRPCAK